MLIILPHKYVKISKGFMFQASYIIQLDTLIKNGSATSGAIQFIETLKRKRMPFVIITEQSGRIRDHIADYMVERGFQYISPRDIYTSCMAAVDYMRIRYPKYTKAFYLGGNGMKEALEKGGYKIGDDHPDFVLVGMNKKATYSDYSFITIALNDGAQLISTDNRKNQVADGMRLIGNASVIKMLEYASDSEAIEFGRGSEILLHMAQSYLSRDSILFVGNDFEKDIKPAKNCNFTTVFVNGGRDISEAGMDEELHPDYIVEDLIGLTK